MKKNKKFLTPEIITGMIEMREKGFTFGYISKQTGFNSCARAAILKKRPDLSRVKIHNPDRLERQESKYALYDDRIVALRKEGNNYVKIAKKLKISIPKVAERLGKKAPELCGWVVPHVKGKNGCLIKERNARVIEMRRQGITYEGISEEIGITRERVRQILNKCAPDLTGSISAVTPSIQERRDYEYEDLLLSLRKLIREGKNRVGIVEGLKIARTSNFLTVAIQDAISDEPELGPVYEEAEAKRKLEYLNFCSEHFKKQWRDKRYRHKIMEQRHNSRFYTKRSEDMKQLWNDKEWKAWALSRRPSKQRSVKIPNLNVMPSTLKIEVYSNHNLGALFLNNAPKCYSKETIASGTSSIIFTSLNKLMLAFDSRAICPS